MNVVRIEMPPLRRRKDDIPELVKAFLIRAESRGLAQKHVAKQAMDLMMAYDWPGNVRELENLIFRLAALSPDATITQRDIERELRAESLKEQGGEASLETEIETLLHRYVMADLLKGGDDGDKIYQSVLEQVERPLITTRAERNFRQQIADRRFVRCEPKHFAGSHGCTGNDRRLIDLRGKCCSKSPLLLFGDSVCLRSRNWLPAY